MSEVKPDWVKIVDREEFEAAGGNWETWADETPFVGESAIRWLGYWDEHDYEDPSLEGPWCDFTLLASSNNIGDSRPVTETDLNALGYFKRGS